jgi:DNA-binding MurR/RpiR family transcriptional regulator
MAQEDGLQGGGAGAVAGQAVSRPVVHCLAVEHHAGAPILTVTQEEALALVQAGTHAIIGPDPEDEASAAEWESTQRAQAYFRTWKGKP